MSSDPTASEAAASFPIRIGISACLLGHKVRYDGGHKRDRYVTDTLGKYFDWVPVCPEVELGLGTPRETMRLERSKDGIRLVVAKDGCDLTESMREYASERLEKLAAEDLCGFVLKSDSPSCGMESVRVYRKGGTPARNGRGLFAEALLERFPHLPVEEEGRLCDTVLRENWVERVFAFRRLRTLWRRAWTLGDLVEFHAANKLAILAHCPSAYESLGRIVARAGSLPAPKLEERYHSEFMDALRVIATRGRHVNVLQHMAGYFKQQLDRDSRQELAGLIGDYRRGALPLIVPVTLIKHYVRRFGIQYLAAQTYLNSHPKELALRNHV